MHRTRTPHVCTHVCNGRTRTAHKRIGFYRYSNFMAHKSTFILHACCMCMVCALRAHDSYSLCACMFGALVHARCTHALCTVCVNLRISCEHCAQRMCTLHNAHVHRARTSAPYTHVCTAHIRIGCVMRTPCTPHACTAHAARTCALCIHVCTMRA